MAFRGKTSWTISIGYANCRPDSCVKMLKFMEVPCNLGRYQARTGRGTLRPGGLRSVVLQTAGGFEILKRRVGQSTWAPELKEFSGHSTCKVDRFRRGEMSEVGTHQHRHHHPDYWHCVLLLTDKQCASKECWWQKPERKGGWSKDWGKDLIAGSVVGVTYSIFCKQEALSKHQANHW